MLITIQHEVSKDRIADLLCSALEGGSNYWYMVKAKENPKIWEFDERPVYKTMAEANKNIKFHYLQYYPLNKGGALLIDDSRADEPELKKPVRLDLASIENGLQLMADKYINHWTDFVNEQDDANTADVFLQLCIFGEVIYG